ncbi:hypothetical protein PGB34_01090 [Xenophilus arseniciresistens]|uniref:Histidine kinase/HSP90-like ATPase domain-containing protein n=1 Tax=Xenophilus arseniciresistens TaxID=1283306 RepID=A0AAE3N478_9BURK|nr:ATP-binding protein [Xenophilus arseniciresistens]MDA7414946.1 hypothetical protein [Xenophilus arseniciresistens]
MLPHVGSGDTWYRVFFDAEPRNAEAWAAYVPYLYGGGALWLNGVALSQIPSSGAQTTVRWERPFLFTFSDELLRPGRNELLIRVSASSITHARMPRLEIGPFSTLHAKYEQRRFWVRTMPQYTVLSCLLVGSLGLFLWWRRREELLYGLFGLASILWGWRTLTFLVETLPSNLWPYWRVLYYTTTGGFIILLLIFSLRLAGTVRPRIERALLLYWLLGPLAYGLSGGSESLVGKLWQGGTIPMGLAILVACTIAALRQRTGPLIALALAIAMAVAAGVHDYLLATTPISGHASAGWFGHRIYLLHYGADLVLLVMGAILATRFVGALHTVEQLNQTLEARVQDRERTLQANYIQMHALERQQAVSEERRRIMRDLHDGLGSRLFVALSRVEAGEIEHEGMAQTLRDCIADMRLALEVMSPAENDFMEAWGSFRFRWDRQLQQAGLQTHWRVRSEREPMALSAEAGMQLLRIAQEALTNVLKHARARQVNIELLCTQADVCLSVSDDGTSFSAANSAYGRGLANMRARAQKLGGGLHLDAGPAGTRIDLRFPYVEAPSRA